MIQSNMTNFERHPRFQFKNDDNSLNAIPLVDNTHDVASGSPQSQELIQGPDDDPPGWSIPLPGIDNFKVAYEELGLTWKPPEGVPKSGGATFQVGKPLSVPLRYAATDGASDSGGIITNSAVQDGRFMVPVPRLGPITVLFQIDGQHVFAGWDDVKKWAIHTDGPYIIGQTPLGEPRKFLLPEGYDKYDWVKIPSNYAPPRD